MPPVNNYRPAPSASQRITSALQNVNSPLPCKRCGGIFFEETMASMFTGGSYGVRAVSQTPMKVYRCLCGELLVPAGIMSGNPSNGERDLFARSIQAAQLWISEHSTGSATGTSVGSEELAELQSQLNELVGRFNGMILGETELPPVNTSHVSAPRVPSAEPIFGGSVVTYEDDHSESQEEVSQSRGQESAPAARSRSASMAIPGNSDGRIIEATLPKPVEGGARGRLKRQGQQ